MFIFLAIIFYIMIAGFAFGIELYIKKNSPDSPFYNYGHDDGEQNACMVLVAFFWPITSPFYFGYYIANKLSHK